MLKRNKKVFKSSGKKRKKLIKKCCHVRFVPCNIAMQPCITSSLQRNIKKEQTVLQLGSFYLFFFLK